MSAGRTRKDLAASLELGMGTLLYYEKRGLVPPPRRSASLLYR